MEWFSVWLPVATQLVLPLTLLVWLALGRHATTARLGAVACLVAACLMAVGIAGLWLVLPWWLPFVYGAAFAWIAALRLRRGVRAPQRRTARHRVATLAIAALSLVFAGVALVALAARRPPDAAVDVAFPLGSGTYLVVNGGGRSLVNAHLTTLEGERFARYRGQSYGVDLVRINGAGLRVMGLLPRDPAAYVIYGDHVMAPCRGPVVHAEDGAADMPPPRPDRAHMAGNHVILGCGSVWIVLGHLQRGSVAVRAGEVAELGQTLGLVGNSGNTGEPHLHIHAQRPGTPDARLSGEPVPIRLDGRYLVRNDQVRATPRE